MSSRPHPVARQFALSLLVAIHTLWASRSGPAQPPGIVGVYEELRIAIETEDANSILAQFSPLLRLQASLEGGWLRDLNVIFGQRDRIAVEMRFDEVQVVDTRAFVLVTWAFSGTSSDTGDLWNATVQRADLLIMTGGRWFLLKSDPVDAQATAERITEGLYVDPETGLEAATPPGWRVLALAGDKASVAALSPDLTTWLMWVVCDLPASFTVEQLATAQEDALVKLAPTIGVQVRGGTRGQEIVAERPAYRVRRTIIGPDGLELYSDLTYCLVGSTLYLCARSALPARAYATYEPVVDRAVGASRIIETRPAVLPPEAGRIEGNKYVNDVYGCEIIAPEGWAIRIGQGNFKLQVTMQEPGGDSTLSLGMIELPSPDLTAEQAVLGDDNITSQAFEGFELVKRGETTVGGLPAYESVTRFNFGGQTRQRHRVYLVDGARLYFMFADAVPADKWTKLSSLFAEAFASFRLTGNQ